MSSVQSHPEQTINHRDFIFYTHMHLCPISKPSKNYVAVTIILKLAAIFVFSLNLSPGHTVDDTDFIFGRLMYLYTLFMCAKNGIDHSLIYTFLPMSIVACIVLVL